MTTGLAKLLIAAPVLAVYSVVGAASSPAQVTLDGSANPSFKGPAPFEAGTYDLRAELGRRAGPNLFHSFGKFSLRTGERASFSGPDGIRNVISRVTGGARSDIHGTIASTIPGADFYFLNPAGVMFGPNAGLDLQGSFHVSTADELRFADGVAFSAADRSASSFSVAPPAAFGFLGGRPGDILIDRSTLVVPAAGEALSFVAGDVRLAGGAIFANNVLVAAQHADGTVPVAPQGAPVVRDGRVTLAPDAGAGASIFSSGPTGGTIRIEGGEITIDRSNLFELNPSDLDSTGGISVAARSMTVVGQGNGLRTDGTGRGRAGPITVVASKVRVAGGIIFTSAIDSGSAPAGDITIRADRVELESLGQISAPMPPEVAPSTEGGAITVIANDSLTLRGGSLISSSTAGQGDAGAVVIRAGRLEVTTALPTAPGLLASTVATSTFGGGGAGSIDIEAAEIAVDNGFISAGTAPNSTGSGGDLHLSADHLVVTNTASINANTLGAGDGGSIAIEATDDVEVTAGATIGALTSDTGRGGTIAIATPRLRLDGGRINASTRGSRNAGSITIQADEVTILNEGQINSSTFAEGDGGAISVEAGTLLVDATRPDTVDTTGIAASATRSSSGAAGNVRIEADEIRLVNDSEIRADTEGHGRGGNLTITAGGLHIDDARILATTGREAAQTADAGAVSVMAQNLEILNRGVISAGTSGPGDGGDLTVEAGTLVVDGTEDTPSELFTGIASEAERGSTGRSGNIVVRAGVLEIRDDAGIANSTLGAGAGGRLRVEAAVIRLRDDGNIVSSSFSVEPGAGDAGELTVVASERLDIDNAFIGTESRAAGGGRIDLEVGELLFLTDAGEISSSVFGGAGTTAGDITIDPRFIVLDGSSIIAQASGGRGGNIRISADNLILSPDSAINAEAGDEGIDGTVVVSAPEVDLSGGLVVLQGALLDAASQLRERCGARRDVGASSFTGVGRGGLPPSPDGPLASAYSSGEVALGEEQKPGSRRIARAAPADVRLAGPVAPCTPPG